MRGHQTVIITGLAGIAIVLVALSVTSERPEQAQVLEANALDSVVLATTVLATTPVASKTTPPQATVSQISPSPTPSATPTLSTTPKSSPSSTATPTPRSTSTPIATPRSSATPTPTATPSLTPTPTATLTPTPSSTPVIAGHVVINEIGWMGTDASATDEWLELYNPTAAAVDLTGWILKSSTDDSPHIVLKGTIPPNGYFLIERTDDQTIGDIAAGLVSSFGQGGLNNSGEVLQLVNADGTMVDQAGTGGAWFAGTASPRASMERISADRPGTDADNWATNDGVTIRGHDQENHPILGTPGGRNSRTR